MLETGFDVCGEGCVSFSHPTNQKNVAGATWNRIKCSIRQAGEESEWLGVSSCIVCVCVCVCVRARACVCACVCALTCHFSQIYLYSFLKKWEGAYTPTVNSPPLALQVLRMRGEYIRLSQDSLSTCCGEKAKEIEVNYSLRPGETHNYAKRCRQSHLRLPATTAFVPTDVGRRRKWAKKVG